MNTIDLLSLPSEVATALRQFQADRRIANIRINIKDGGIFGMQVEKHLTMLMASKPTAANSARSLPAWA